MARRGRVAKDVLEQAMAEAVRLAVEERMKPKEIAPRLGFGLRTIQNWIKGKTPSTSEVVLSSPDRPAEEIAAELRRSAGHIANVVRELRQKEGAPRKPSPKSPDDDVQKYLADPRGLMDAPFTRFPKFRSGLVHACALAAENNPAEGLATIRVGIEYFEAGPRGMESREIAAACRLMQCYGALAYAYSELQQHRKACRLLERSYAQGLGQCPACDADN